MVQVGCLRNFITCSLYWSSKYNSIMEKPQNGNRVGYNKSDNIAVKHVERIIFIILPTYTDTGDCIFVSTDFSYEIDVVI